MVSLRTPRKSASLLVPPRFHFFHRLKHNAEFTRVFITDNDDTPGTFPQAQKSLVQIVTTCLEALDRISKIESIKSGLGKTLDDMIDKRDIFNNFLTGIPIIALTKYGDIETNDRMVLVSLVLQMSAILVQLICLFHPQWLYLDKKQVQRDYDAIMRPTSRLLGIDIPWKDITFHQPDNHDIELTRDQSKSCDGVIARGRFGELRKLMMAIEDKGKWEVLKWSKRQTSSLSLGFQNVVSLLDKIMVLVNRPRWAGYMLPLPSQLALEEQSIEDDISRANFHVQWTKPVIMSTVISWMGGFSRAFKLGSATPNPMFLPWKDTGLWLINSAPYQAWYNSANGTNERFLWCLGDIGMGKSVLMNAIVWQHQTLSKRLPVHMRPVYVQIHNVFDQQGSAPEILRAILKQVLAEIKMPTDLIVSIYQNVINGRVTFPDTEEIFALLGDLTKAYNIYFFIDGLDECDLADSNELITGLLSLGPNHRVICFSRPFSLIHEKAFSDFTFWKIQADRSDMEIYLKELISYYDERPRDQVFSSSQERVRVCELVERHGQGWWLVLASQALLIKGSPVERPVIDFLREIPESIFDRHEETINRLRRTLSPKDPIFNTIAWTCVNGYLSVTNDAPHIVPKLPASALESIRAHVDSSLGILHIVDGSIQFASKLALTFVLTNFESLFPTFFSDVPLMMAGFTQETREWRLMESLELFICSRETVHHNSDGQLGYSSKFGRLDRISPA